MSEAEQEKANVSNKTTEHNNKSEAELKNDNENQDQGQTGRHLAVPGKSPKGGRAEGQRQSQDPESH